MDTDAFLTVLATLGFILVVIGHNALRHQRETFVDKMDDYCNTDSFEEDLIYTWLSDDAKDAPNINVRSKTSKKRKKEAAWN